MCIRDRAWVYITTDRNDYTVFFGLGSNELIGTGGDGTTLLHYDGTMERTGSNLSTGTWFHLAYVSNGDALANGFTVYLNGAADITYTVRSLTSAGTNMYLGNDEYSEWLNGRMAHVKIWNVALTAAEIQQEMYSSRPQRFTNLWSVSYTHLDVYKRQIGKRSFPQSVARWSYFKMATYTALILRSHPVALLSSSILLLALKKSPVSIPRMG